MKKVKILIIALGLVVVAIISAFKDDLFQISKNIDVFVSLYKEINLNYVEETNASELIKKGIDGMLISLDPYTEFVPSSEIETYKLKYLNSQYSGIGVATIIKDGRLYINEIIEGYAAQKNNLLPGDEIVTINGISTKDKDRTALSTLIRGSQGSTVEITLLRNNQTLNKTLIRDKVKLSNVSYHGMINNNTGYIKLNKFLENSAQEVQGSLQDLLKHDAKNIILDLRNNGGGILQEAVKIVNLFVEKNNLIVVQKGRNSEKNIVYKTINEAIAPSIPLIVLINRGSASASEIVAGSLQDLDRAVIVGQRSFGKGLVQQTFNLPYNNLVKVTVAKYYTPSGRCIQALDYAHKQSNGKVLKFADSSISAFKTKIGRTVYDGNGISPDITVNAQKLNAFSVNLINKNLFFDYANLYWKKNKQISNAREFKISNNDYIQFANSLSTKEITFESTLDKMLKNINLEIKKEIQDTLLKKDINAIISKVNNTKNNNLFVYKEEIKQILESQIISRYYYEKGKIEQSFQYDNELKKAISILNDKQLLLAILEGKNSFRIIGNKSNPNEDFN